MTGHAALRNAVANTGVALGAPEVDRPLDLVSNLALVRVGRAGLDRLVSAAVGGGGVQHGLHRAGLRAVRDLFDAMAGNDPGLVLRRYPGRPLGGARGPAGALLRRCASGNGESGGKAKQHSE